jgi:hypothetical protein
MSSVGTSFSGASSHILEDANRRAKWQEFERWGKKNDFGVPRSQDTGSGSSVGSSSAHETSSAWSGKTGFNSPVSQHPQPSLDLSDLQDVYDHSAASTEISPAASHLSPNDFTPYGKSFYPWTPFNKNNALASAVDQIPSATNPGVANEGETADGYRSKGDRSKEKAKELGHVFKDCGQVAGICLEIAFKGLLIAGAIDD